ncbi:MAG: M20 family metallopeptidase [Rubrobacteraceae bacterium]
MSRDLPTGLIEEAEAAIDERRLVETLQALILCRSENPFEEEPAKEQGEEAVARYMSGRLSDLNIECELRELGPRRVNLVAGMNLQVEGPSLMLAGHMDTVRTAGYPEAYSAEERDGFVYGRGACDMKGALACYLEVAEVLRAGRTPLKGSLYLVGVADEEYKMLGAREIGENGPGADGVIVGEPTELAVCPASRGRVTTSIVTRGRAAHSSTPENGVNAVSHMGRVLGTLENYGSDLLERRDPHPLLGRPRVNPGVIEGGSQANIVPDECRLEIDRRTLPGESKEDVYDELESLLADAGKDVPEFRGELAEPGLLVPANEVEPDDPLVVALRKSAEEVLGEDRELRGFLGGSDAGYYGPPAVICGPGSIEQAHTTDEFVAVQDLVLATRLYLRSVLRILGQGG